MKQKNKQILFATGMSVNAGGVDALVEDGGKADPMGLAEVLNTGGRADQLLNIAASWMAQERISYAQYDLLRQRLKKEPAVTDLKLDGDVVVLAIEGGAEERIFPTDPNLPPVVVKDHVPFYEKAWYWIKNHKAVAIGGGSAVLLLVIALIVKHTRS